MMYNDVDNDLPPFNDTIDGEEIFLFSNAKPSSTCASFLNEDDDEHLRHQHNVVASTSSHLPVDVDELLLNSNFLEQPNCDQSEDPLFWNCKDISDDHLNDFLPQSQLNLSNIANGNNINSTNNSNNNNNSNTITSNHHAPIIQQAPITLSQHPQTIIPIQQLQSQSINHHLAHAQIQQQQAPISLQLNQIQQQVTTLQLQQQQHLQQQQQITQQSGFHQQHALSQDFQTKWITLVQTNDQYPTFTTTQPQFFEKSQQQLIQTTDVGTLIQNSVSNLVAAHEQQIQVIPQQSQQQSILASQQQQQPQFQDRLQIQQHQQRHQQQQLQNQHQQQQQPQQQQHQHNHQSLAARALTAQPVLAPQSVASVTTQQQLIPITKSAKISVPASNSATKKETTVKQKSKEKQTRLDCPYCKRSFSKNFDLQQHMRCHTGEKPFQCIVCGRGFAQKSNVKKHMQAHKVWPEGSNNQPLPSNHGSARSRNNSASSSIGTPRDDECMQENESLQINDNNNGITLGLSNDRKSDGNDIFAENRYSCSYCQFNGRTYFELKSHLTIHKREKVFKCIVSSCGKTFAGSDLQGFLDHVTGHKDLIYHCHLCSGQFYSLDEFGEHQKNHSNAQTKRTTQQQSQSQASVAVLNQQNASLRQQNQQVTSTQLQPQQNQRQFNQQQTPNHQNNGGNQKSTQLYNNQPPKNNQKYFRCSKCMNRYTTQTALDHHLSISTHNFPCTECNKVFMCERYLRRHLNTHTAVQHVCTFCDKQFKTAAYLKMHSVVHTGEKPFRCNLCEAAFNRRDKLNRHKLTHETVKRFKCPFKPHIGCTKEFNRPDKLKAHVATHSGIRPHPCDACPRTFARLSRLREHKKLHHDGNNNNGGTNTTTSVTKNNGQTNIIKDNIISTESSGDPSLKTVVAASTTSVLASTNGITIKEENPATPMIAIEIATSTSSNYEM